MTDTLKAPPLRTPPAERAPARRVWTVALAGLGALLLPALRADFGASLSELEWTINAYNLVFACLTLTGAALGDRPPVSASLDREVPPWAAPDVRRGPRRLHARLGRGGPGPGTGPAHRRA